MKDLVSVKDDELTITTRVIAKMLETGNKKRDESIHRDIIKTMENQIFNKVDSVLLNPCGGTGNKIYECSITGATFSESSFNFGKGLKRKAVMWVLNEEAYHLLITQITKYKNAMSVNLQFIKAFKLLKQEYLTQDNKVLSEIVNKDELGKKSDINALPRTKQVRGYYRSKNGKELSQEINQAIKKTQLNLFTYQKEISNEK